MQEQQGEQNPRRGRYKRGYLPHYDADVVTQFVTFRVADSLPRSVIQGLQRNFKCGRISEIEYYQEIDNFLDRGEGPTYLLDARIADSIAETLLKFDGYKYELLSWVIMPNHAHILITPADGY